MTNAPMPDCVLSVRSVTGESPIWDEGTGTFVWVDIPQKAFNVFSLATKRNRQWIAPEEIGAAALTERQGVYALAGSRCLWSFDLETEVFTLCARVELNKAELRFNDGRADKYGRWWVGTLVGPRDESPGAGLFRFDASLTPSREIGGLFLSNGVAFSPDFRQMYHADSRRRTVWRYDYDIDGGVVENRKLFYQFSDDDGLPDGAAVDVDGGYWCAVHGGWRICRIVDGQIDREIRLPVAKPTMCAFGGRDRRDLLITTGSRHFGERDWAEQPLAGGLFMTDAGVAGIPDAPVVGFSHRPATGGKLLNLGKRRPI